MNTRPAPSDPIGVFDSGVGGLSVWREFARELPGEDFLYLADQAHLPYGPRDRAELERFVLAIGRFLRARHCKALVVACNTASAAALKTLRDRYADFIVIGMEPAVKPAAALTRRGVVGVMATPGTFDGRMYRETVRRHAEGIQVVTRACEGLAERIEAGALDDPALVGELRTHLEPILAAEADVIVLACTHYPFVRQAIETLCGATCQILDPAPAVARHLHRSLAARQLLAPPASGGATTFCTTGDPVVFAAALRRLVGVIARPRALAWRDGDTIVDIDPVPARGTATDVA